MRSNSVFTRTFRVEESDNSLALPKLMEYDSLKQFILGTADERIESPAKWFIYSNGGAGKSFILTSLKSEIEKLNYSIVKVLFGTDVGETVHWLKEQKKAEIVTRKLFEISGSNDFDEFISSYKNRYIFFDGLNEVFDKSAQKKIIGALDIICAENGINLIITDRILRKGIFEGKAWANIKLENLSPDYVKSELEKREVDFGVISDRSIELLGLPFFLDKYITLSDKLTIDTRPNFIESLFTHGKDTDQEFLSNIDKLAKIILPSDDLISIDSSWIEVLDSSFLRKLKQRNILIKKKNKYQFTHQIYSDYLAARYIAKRKKEIYGKRIFNHSTYNGSSYEVIHLILEILSLKDVDSFLLAVYDWNYKAAIELLDIHREQNFKPEFRFSIYYTLSEKLFDRFKHTTSGVQDILDSFWEYQPSNLQQVIKEASEIKINVEWYQNWLSVFSSTPSHSDSPFVNQNLLDRIRDSNSIIGWAASNAIKRFKITYQASNYLQELYTNENTDNEAVESLNWRVVHALGASTEVSDIEFLLKKFPNGDLDVKYGISRSLIEIASNSNEEQAYSIFNSFRNFLFRGKLKNDKVISEIIRCLDIIDPPDFWNDVTLSFIDEIYVRVSQEFPKLTESLDKFYEDRKVRRDREFRMENLIE